MSRDQRSLVLYAWEKAKPRLLLEERDEAWINLDPSLPRWLPDGSAFLWSSERDGAWRLELRDKNGALVRPLGGDYHRLVDVDPAARVARYSGGADPSEEHVQEVSLDVERRGR